MGSLSVRSKKGRRAFLLNNVLGQSPKDDGDATLAILLIRSEGIDAMLPGDVGITAKAENAIVGLGEVHAALLPADLFGGVDEGQLSHAAKRHADRNVLVPSTLGIERRRIVMEGLPIAGIAVPVESRADALLLDIEVLTQSVNDHVEGLGFGGILADQVGALVPRDPLGSLGLALGLDLAHLLDELVVQGPVLLFAEELRDDDDVVVLKGAVEDLGPAAADVNAQIGTDEGRRRIERLGIAAVASMRCLLGDALGRVRATGIVLQITKLSVGLLVGNVVIGKLFLGWSGLALLVLVLVVVMATSTAAAASARTFVVTRGGRARA